MASIRASLARFGQAEPLVVHKATGRVIGGNGRLAAMRELGWSHADVVEIETDAVEATALSIALNRTAELAGWNTEVLGRVLDSLRTEDALEGVGYSAEEIDALLADLEADAGDGELEQDEAPALPDDATTRAGDLWVLGDHRLLCGDSGIEADVDRLLGGAEVPRRLRRGRRDRPQSDVR
jgi:ParB-like chromosome segregation protein Spo0J